MTCSLPSVRPSPRSASASSTSATSRAGGPWSRPSTSCCAARLSPPPPEGRGTYVLADAAGGAGRATLIATGPEVAIALAARDPLQAAGVPTAVVSMPCGELFGRQDANYRASVIDRATVRVAVEAAVRHGWDRWIGEDGGFVGMSRFGAPGPETELFAHFGITAERVAAEVQAWLQGLIP